MTAQTETISNFSNHFLIAMPQLDGTFFEHAVIYVCTHDENGAMGITINHPMNEVSFNEIMDSMDIIPKHGIQKDPIVYAGGPVDSNRGFVLHTTDYEHETTMPLARNISLSASADIVSAIAEGQGPDKLNFCLGYSGWEPGELEQEIAENSWLILPADDDILFDLSPEERYQAAVKRLGFDPAQVVNEGGTA